MGCSFPLILPYFLLVSHLFEMTILSKFEDLPPEIRSQRQGFLYRIIEDIYQDQQRVIQIFADLEIRKDNDLSQDKKIIDDIIDKVLNAKKTQYKFWPIFPKDEEKERQDMEWIAIGSFIIVGLYFWSQYSSKDKSENKEGESQIRKNTLPRQSTSSSPPRRQIPAVLSLVVPASEVSNLRENTEIKTEQIKEIIDKASYFLCSSQTNAKSLQLKTIDEAILSQSQREVYIEIELPNGREIIDKTNLYLLTRDLAPNQPGTIKQLKCLKDLSGLEKFHRI
jgi:hypothetical protein